ncbi:S9 family peptidase [Salibacter halophilus]|uniref:S9 family peptidase n=1 Tax=Salibacter halophilus TaxID=1803916 RepID=A0A6N6M9Y0_9FLAO|nr:S9 family peptidase [Salibacter halophilus]KAB1063905.1 S9 family peptidase [Salibacter halophilus]
MKKFAIAGIAVFFSLLSFGQNRMTPEKLWELGRVSGEVFVSQYDLVVYSVTKYDVAKNSGGSDLYVLNNRTGQVNQITDMEGSEYGVQLHPNGKSIGFINSGKLFEVDLSGMNVHTMENQDVAVSHFKYSPSGDKIAFTTEVKVKDPLVAKYPDLGRANAKIYTDLMYRHWDTWEDGSYSHLHIADYREGVISNIKDIMPDEPYDVPVKPFHGAEDFTWSPDGKTLAYVCKKLTGKEYAESTNTDIYFYDVKSGKTENVTEANKGYDTDPQFNENGTLFAWLSMERDGYESDQNELKIANTDDIENPVNITQNWDRQLFGFAFHGNNEVIINAGDEATYQLYSMSAAIDKKVKDLDETRKAITSGDHNITGIVGVGPTRVVAHKSTMNRANELYSYNIESGEEKQLTKVNDKAYSKIKESKIEKRFIETTDGEKMLTWVIYPPDFDPKKKYPTLLYCQGGPQSAVSQFYSFRWNFQLMAAKGYIVVAPNRRGLPTFGQEWNEEISKNWGGQAIDDYKAAFDAVIEEPYCDNERTGAVGASYGGYSVYFLAGNHEDRFNTFISHCGLFNLESWYGSTEELFFANFDIGGPYWGNNPPESYEKYSPHNFVDNWDSPMMVIHSGKDFRVPYTQGMEAFQAAQLKGLKSKFLYFPDENHWILKPQNGLLWQREFFSWLEDTIDGE